MPHGKLHWLLQLSLSQPAQVSDHPAPTDPELSCICCCQSSQIQSHHSHPSVSALVKNNRADRIQTPFTYLQPPNLHICITSSQFSLLAALAPHLWSRSSIHIIFSVNNSSFQYASLRFWNQVPASVHQSDNHTPILSNSDSPNPLSGTSSIGSIDSPLSLSITRSLFHSRLKTFLFSKSFPPSLSSSGLTPRIPWTVYWYLLSISFSTF